MRRYKHYIIVSLLLIYSPYCLSQQDSSVLDKTKLNKFIISSTAAYAVSLIGLNELWYKNYPREKFHFFNDSKEWKQMDKVGHAYSAYHISNTAYKALTKTGLSNKKSYLWGSAVGLLFMTPIEIMDGYSSEYGASTSDLLFNLSGSLLFATQGYIWNEQRIYPKFSFQRSQYASLRPNVLGSNLVEEILKDYNGQNYWLSIDIYKFLDSKTNYPKWLNIAIGYGAHNMIYANDSSNENNGYSPYRQYYFGLDIDLTHIPTKSKFIKGLLFVLNMVHLPTPTLEFTKKGAVKFYSFYF
ncbi:MAG: YfiM family protein [Cyclobacteriaceae bacterium]|nr:YfiM family protein [Cyclobacteriaceae bacterium]